MITIILINSPEISSTPEISSQLRQVPLVVNLDEGPIIIFGAIYLQACVVRANQKTRSLCQNLTVAQPISDIPMLIKQSNQVHRKYHQAQCI